MPYVDISILSVILLSLVIGVYKGFVKETLSLATLVLSVVAAFYLSKYPASWLPSEVTTYAFSLFGASLTGHGIAIAVSFTIIFLLTMFAGYVLTNAINSLIKASPLNWFNRLLGGAFGAVRGAVIMILLIIFAQNFTKMPHNLWWQESRTLPILERGAWWSINLLPEEYAAGLQFNPQIEEEKIQL